MKRCMSYERHLIFDARGNGGGEICPTITGDHQNRVTDYTAVVVDVTDEENIRRDEVLPMGRV